MSAKNVQFSVAVHIMTALAYHAEDEMVSDTLSASVKAEPTFVRKVLSKLSKAGLVHTTRGRNGQVKIARPAAQITLLDIYEATEVPEVFSVHSYPAEKSCKISLAHKGSMTKVLQRAQTAFEKSLRNTRLSELENEV